MRKTVFRTAVAALALSTLVLAVSLPASAEVVPLRSGKVVATESTKTFTYIQAVDDQEKEFWVLTSVCAVGVGGTIDVIAGSRYDEITHEDLGVVFKDVYTAQLIRIDGTEIKGFGAHGLPAGCITIR